jgi:ATP-dependent Clp protease protease subunit
MIRNNGCEHSEEVQEGELLEESIVDNKTLSELLEQADIYTRTVYLRREVDIDSVANVGDIIRYYNLIDNEENVPIEDRQPILLRISTSGGHAIVGMNLVDTIMTSSTPVWTVIEGEACSMGIFISMSGHRRFCYDNSVGLIHCLSIDQLGGKSRNVAEHTDFIRRYEAKKLKELILKTTKITDKLYEEKYHSEWYLLSEDMLELGIVDEILK